MTGKPSIRLDYSQTPEQSFKELHSEFSLETIDEMLFSWLSTSLTSTKPNEAETDLQLRFYGLVKRALFQTQRLVTPTTESKIEYVQIKLNEINQMLA